MFENQALRGVAQFQGQPGCILLADQEVGREGMAQGVRRPGGDARPLAIRFRGVAEAEAFRKERAFASSVRFQPGREVGPDSNEATRGGFRLGCFDFDQAGLKMHV